MVLVNVVAFVVLGPVPARAVGVGVATDFFAAVVVRAAFAGAPAVVVDAGFLPAAVDFVAATLDTGTFFAGTFFAAAFVTDAVLAAGAFFAAAFVVGAFLAAALVAGAFFATAVPAFDVAVFFAVSFDAIRTSVARAIAPDKWG
ncbi:MAG: hypothetical protein ABIS35_12720 [Terracoccus sp.]